MRLLGLCPGQAIQTHTETRSVVNGARRASNRLSPLHLLMLLDEPLKVQSLLFHVCDELFIDTTHPQFSGGDVGIRNHLAELVGRVTREAHKGSLRNLLQRMLRSAGIPLRLWLLIDRGRARASRRGLRGHTRILSLGLALLRIHRIPLLRLLKE